MDVDNSDIDVIACKFRTMNTNDKDYLISEFKRLSNTQLGTEGCCFYLDLAEWNLNSALWAYYEYETVAAAAASSSSQSAAINQNHNNQVVETVDEPSARQYYYNQARLNEIPEMQFVCDITIGEGESVAPNTNFVKTWRIKNTGTTRWPTGCTLRYVNGYNFSTSPSSSSSSSSLHSSPSSSSSTSEFGTQQLQHLHQQHQNAQPIEIELPELGAQESADVSVSLVSPAQCGIYQCQYRTYTRLGQPFGDPIWLLLNVEEGGVLGITQQLNSVNMFGGTPQQQQQKNRTPSTRSTAYFYNPVAAAALESSELKTASSSTHNETDSNNNNHATPIEKRPDFYDDMFR